LCLSLALILGPLPTDEGAMRRVTCMSCGTYDIAETVVNWLEQDTEGKRRAQYVADASRRKERAGSKLQIYSVEAFMLIAWKEEGLQDSGDLG
jgi:hypothetical protein